MAAPDGLQELERIRQLVKQRQYPTCGLFYGDEDFLVSQVVDLIRSSALEGIPKDFNYNQYHAKEDSGQAIVDTANTLPMASPHRLVLVKDVFDLKPASLALLIRYVKKPCPSTILMMVGALSKKHTAGDSDDGGAEPSERDASASKALGKAGKGARGLEKSEKGTPTELINAARKSGMVIEFRQLYDNKLQLWVRSEASRLGKRIGSQEVNYLLDMVGDGLRELYGELTKVALFVGSRDSITLPDLQAVVSDIGAEALDELKDAVAEKRPGPALLQISNILERDPTGGIVRIISVLRRHVQMMLQAKPMLDAQMNAQEVAVKVGIKESIAWKFEKSVAPQIRRRSSAELVRMLDILFETELSSRRLKTSPAVLLDHMILRLCA